MYRRTCSLHGISQSLKWSMAVATFEATEAASCLGCFHDSCLSEKQLFQPVEF